MINFCLFFHFSISLSNVIHIGKFVSKISQKLLRLGFWNLVQMLGMTCCIVWKRISILLLIVPIICSFFFLSKQIFCCKFLSFYESFVCTLRVAKYIVGQKTKLRFILPSFSFSERSVRVAERLALPTSDHGVAGSNPAGGEILPEPKRRFIAQSLSCSPFHRLEMTEILLKGRKTLTHPSILFRTKVFFR